MGLSFKRWCSTETNKNAPKMSPQKTHTHIYLLAGLLPKGQKGSRLFIAGLSGCQRHKRTVSTLREMFHAWMKTQQKEIRENGTAKQLGVTDKGDMIKTRHAMAP